MLPHWSRQRSRSRCGSRRRVDCVSRFSGSVVATPATLPLLDRKGSDVATLRQLLGCRRSALARDGAFPGSPSGASALLQQRCCSGCRVHADQRRRCDASNLTALARGRKTRTQRGSIEFHAPANTNARPIIAAVIVGARARAMGRYRESPRAQPRSYHSGFCLGCRVHADQRSRLRRKHTHRAVAGAQGAHTT